MQCPVCQSHALVMSERQGIEIDYCPQCRGVWLDRGELDKIIERAGAAPAPAPAPAVAAPAPGYAPSYDDRERARRENHHGGYYKKKKREGFLSDIFDFD